MFAEMLLMVLGLTMGLLWLLVPFALFAVRSLLRQVLEEQRRTNALLEHIGGYRIPKPQPEPTAWRAP